MKRKYHVKLSFKWFDFWIGFFLDVPAKALYICLLPMLPIKIWITDHETCPECGSAMHKIAIWTGDGWDLQWECDKEAGYHFKDIEWPFRDGLITTKDLKRLGYEII